MKDYTNQIAELKADVQTIWKLQCQNLYNSKNLGALAVRECIQNSIDAIRTAEKKGEIVKGEGRINVSWEGNNLIVEDNGIGMNLETLHNKFLTLGGTTKGDEDNVGGFGLAKSVILGCGEGFKVETQDNVFTDSDLGVNPIQKQDYFHGTRITVYKVQTGKGKTIEDNPDSFRYAVQEYIFTSEIPKDITVMVNGKEYSKYKRFASTASTRRIPAVFNIDDDLIPSKTKIRINVHKAHRDSSSFLFVRLRGLTQFKQYLSWNADFHVVLDIDTKLDPRDVDYPFSTNREGLKAQYQGILQAISDKVSQSPIAISDHNNYKETLYNNKNSTTEQARVIASSLISKELAATAEKACKAMQGIIPQGGYRVLSVAEKVKKFNEKVEEVAADCGVTKSDVVKKLNSDNIHNLNNPLDYSWIVWEDKDTKAKKLNRNTQVSIILAWDGILRLMGSNSVELNNKVFYPGIIVRKDYMGLCLEKNIVPSGVRHYIMLNPHLIPNEDEMSVALYLMNLAAHELAHLAVGTYEAHGETFSYTRESIMNQNLSQVNNVRKMLKAMNFKKLLSRIHSNSSDKSQDFSYKHIEELIQMAQESGIDVRFLHRKYTDPRIFRMRLIMAIKKAN